MRKSKREKEKEAADAKAREEEEHAAKAYAEFMETFEGHDYGSKSDNSFVKAADKSAYNPLQRDHHHSDGSSRPLPQAFDMASSPPPSGPPKPKGKRAMDAFLEEIKR